MTDFAIGHVSVGQGRDNFVTAPVQIGPVQIYVGLTDQGEARIPDTLRDATMRHEITVCSTPASIAA